MNSVTPVKFKHVVLLHHAACGAWPHDLDQIVGISLEVVAIEHLCLCADGSKGLIDGRGYYGRIL